MVSVCREKNGLKTNQSVKAKERERERISNKKSIATMLVLRICGIILSPVEMYCFPFKLSWFASQFPENELYVYGFHYNVFHIIDKAISIHIIFTLHIFRNSCVIVNDSVTHFPGYFMARDVEFKNIWTASNDTAISARSNIILP